MGFREDFVWGAATSAYQVEGSAFIDGKGLSIWDVFSRTPKKVYKGHTGEVACDHYKRFKEDVLLMKEMGIKAYRFSISWPRILPDGIGKVNQQGLDFYDALVDELLKSGIEPYITLFHWDFPYELYKKGGWLNRDSADWFAEYTRAIVERLSDRVKYWMTQNEPQCYIGLGHLSGSHAPGLMLPWNEVLLAGHHSMLAHGKSVMAIRQCAKQNVMVGYAPCGKKVIPASNTPQDIEAARRMMLEDGNKSVFWIPLLVDPVILGKYPEEAFKVFGKDMPDIQQEDLNIMCQPLDFIGFNFYQGVRAKMGSHGEPEPVNEPIGEPQTAMGWPVTPDVMYWGPKFLYERYKLPFYITENGMANLDWVSTEGRVYDYQRIDFLRRYIGEYKRLAEEGIDVRGYFQWSLMDNFEWSHGYSMRFGLVHVDYSTQKRTIKESGEWYKKVIECNGKFL